MTDEISKLQTEPADPVKKYEACKQKSGSGDNEITILMSDIDKAKVYLRVRQLRKENKSDGFHYWMRPVHAPKISEAPKAPDDEETRVKTPAGKKTKKKK